MLKFAILGCGRIGQVHSRSILSSPDAELVAVSDALPKAAQALAATTGATVQTTDQIMANPEIGAVAICSPTTTHSELIHQAAAHGKAIFCEKPIDLSAERIRESLKVVKAAGVPFMVAFHRRYDPNFSNLQARIARGDIGKVELITILSRDPSPPPVEYIKTSGGIFRDMVIHDFDMARFLLGEEPVSIYATGSCLVDPAIGEAGDFDTAAVTLRTASGKICQINNSRRATYGHDQRIEVHGSKGLLRAHNQRETTVELATGSGFEREPAMHFFLERYREAYASELAHFIEAVKTGTPPSPNGQDGLKAQLIADAASASAEDGQAKTI